MRLADVLGVSEVWLRSDVGPAMVTIPAVGRVSAGKSFIPIDDNPQGGGFEELEFSLDDADPIAIAVQGESMLRSIGREITFSVLGAGARKSPIA
ncbi:MAG: hypothetical protein VW169_01275 [Rhodospirillaceae bacterium]